MEGLMRTHKGKTYLNNFTEVKRVQRSCCFTGNNSCYLFCKLNSGFSESSFLVVSRLEGRSSAWTAGWGGTSVFPFVVRHPRLHLNPRHNFEIQCRTYGPVLCICFFVLSDAQATCCLWSGAYNKGTLMSNSLYVWHILEIHVSWFLILLLLQPIPLHL